MVLSVSSVLDEEAISCENKIDASVSTTQIKTEAVLRSLDGCVFKDSKSLFVSASPWPPAFLLLADIFEMMSAVAARLRNSESHRLVTFLSLGIVPAEGNLDLTWIEFSVKKTQEPLPVLSTGVLISPELGTCNKLKLNFRVKLERSDPRLAEVRVFYRDQQE